MLGLLDTDDYYQSLQRLGGVCFAIWNQCGPFAVVLPIATNRHPSLRPELAMAAFPTEAQVHTCGG